MEPPSNEDINLWIENVLVKKLGSLLSLFKDDPRSIQSRFMNDGILEKILNKYFEMVEEEMDFYPGLSVFLKIIVNCVTLNEEVSLFVLDRWSKRFFQSKVLTLFSESKKYCRRWIDLCCVFFLNIVSVIINSLQRVSKKYDDEDEVEGEEDPSNHQEMKEHYNVLTKSEFLEVLLDHLYVTNESTQENDTDNTTTSIRSLFERLILFLPHEKLVDVNIVNSMCQKFIINREYSRIVRLLEIVEHIITEKKHLPPKFRNVEQKKQVKEEESEGEEDQKEDEDADECEEEEEMSLTRNEVLDLERFFSKCVVSVEPILTFLVMNKESKILDHLTNENIDNLSPKTIEEISDVLYLSLKIISEMTDDKTIKKSECLNTLIELKYFKILRKLFEHIVKNAEMKKKALESIGVIVGVRTSLLKILSDLSHENTNMQDEIREHDLIPFVLMYTKLDRREPLLREWSLFCIKNLTHLNAKNQEFIKEFLELNATGAEQNIMKKME